ncbi:MAG TPA: sensor histidine kinase [Candidatus Mediterraneibacter merdavium]|nr:sensor histidine kinase [Candidatus Mediterraneibacter merdavium]
MRRKDSIFFRLTLTFVCLGLLPIMAATAVLYRAFAGNTEETMMRNLSSLIRYAGDNISLVLDEYSRLTWEIYYQDVDSGVMLADFLKSTGSDSKERQLTMNMVMQNLVDEDSKIRTACFLDNEGKLSYATKNTQKVMNEEKWMASMKSLRILKNGIRMAGAHTDDYFSGSQNQVLTFVAEFNDNTVFSDIRYSLGTLYLDIDFSAISELASDISLNEDGVFRIVDGSRVCVYSYNPQEIGRRLKNVPAPEMTGNQAQKHIKADGSYYVYFKIPDTEWTAEVEVSEDSVLKNVKAVQIYIGIFLAVSVAALLLVYRNYLKGIRAPMGRLIRGMNEIQSGNLKTRVEPERMDEIGGLAAGLNQMTEALDSYIQRVYVSELKQRETELDMLKTQIRPHYLYNTLEVIRMQAVSNDDPETAEMVESLSKQLRYLIGKTGDIVPLKDELENIGEYFKLLRMRYENRFELEIHVPEEVKNLFIIKLSLQPVVENAVKHGLLPKAKGGIISISALTGSDALEVTVMDDGVGMDADKLEEVRRNIEADEDGSYSDGRLHIGVRNTAERLRKAYGRKYGIQVASERGVGTVITVRYPILYKEEEAQKKAGKQEIF